MKRIILVTVAVLLGLGVIAYSAYVYQVYRKPAPTISASQAVKERNQAIVTMRVHDAVNKTNLDKANQETTDTQAKLTSVCTSLKTTKVTNPNCQ